MSQLRVNWLNLDLQPSINYLPGREPQNANLPSLISKTSMNVKHEPQLLRASQPLRPINFLFRFNSSFLSPNNDLPSKQTRWVIDVRTPLPSHM